MIRYFLWRAWGPYLGSLYLVYCLLVLTAGDRDACAALCGWAAGIGLPLALIVSLLLCYGRSAQQQTDNPQKTVPNPDGWMFPVGVLAVSVVLALFAGHNVARVMSDGGWLRACVVASLFHAAPALLTLLGYPLYARGAGRGDAVRAARDAVWKFWKSHPPSLSAAYPRHLLEALISERMPLDAAPEQAWAAGRELLELLRREAERGGCRQKLDKAIQEEQQAIQQLRLSNVLNEDLRDREISARKQKLRDLEQQRSLLDS